MCMLTLIESTVYLYVYHILLREDIAYVHPSFYRKKPLLMCMTRLIELTPCLYAEQELLSADAAYVKRRLY